MDIARDREQGREAIEELVRRFGERADYYTSRAYDEASARAAFVDPFFLALGWDVSDVGGLGPSREVIVEHTFRPSATAAGPDEWDEELTKEELAERSPALARPDYTFRINGAPVLVAEAKPPRVNVRSKKPLFQVKSYSWSMQLPVGLVTNFRTLRLFDTTKEPDYDEPEAGLLENFDIAWREYVSAWDRIWETLSRPAVEAGSLENLGRRNRQRHRGALPVNDAFFTALQGWRERLAQDLVENNHALDRWQLSEATQRILDRVVFVRVCEDRGIEPNVVLRRYARTTESYRRACREFRRLDAVYNGVIFKEHWSEQLQVSDKVFQGLIASLYFPAATRFDVVGVEVLGHAYEKFLGREIELSEKGSVRLVEKPEVRHAGGVYYTPRYIVDYIVENSLDPFLKDKTPRAAANLRIVDPACGSGAFLLGAFEYLIRWHEAYFTINPSETPDRHFPAKDGTRRLTSDAKVDILSRCLYGVDIDPQAVEVTQMSLYLKVLENENEATLLQQRRLFERSYLPPLDKNIRCGNSLLSTNDVDRRILFDTELLRRVNPFDWHDVEAGFGDVFEDRGGFDAVIGNPPYTRTQVLRQHRPEEAELYEENYQSASEGSWDIAAPFVEKGLSLLRRRGEQGRLGFIVSRQFCEADFGRPLRHLLSSGRHVEEIVDFRSGQVFENASAYTLILLANAAPQSAWTLTRVPPPPSRRALWMAISDPEFRGERPAGVLNANQWDLPLPTEEKLLDRLDSISVPLGELAKDRVFQGVPTGADYVFRLEDLGPAPAHPNCRLVKRRDNRGDRAERGVEPQPVEEALLRPVLAGRSDIRRFEVRPSEEVLLLPYDRPDTTSAFSLIPPTRLHTEFPEAYAWLKGHEEELRSRAGSWSDDDWYSFSRRQNLELFDQDKVLIPYMLEHLCALHDTDGHWFVNVATGGYGIPSGVLSDPDYLTALLSSRLLSWVLAHRSRAWRGGWFAARKGNLVRIPIREPEQRVRAEIVKLFDACVTATSQLNKAATDQERVVRQRVLTGCVNDFDRAVEDVYEVSEKERKLLSAF